MKILCKKELQEDVQEALLACGYGRAELVDWTEMCCRLQISHGQLPEPKELQDYLRKATGSMVVVVS